MKGNILNSTLRHAYIHLFIHPSIHPSIQSTSIHPSIHPSINAYIHSFTNATIHPSMHHSILSRRHPCILSRTSPSTHSSINSSSPGILHATNIRVGDNFEDRGEGEGFDKNPFCYFTDDSSEYFSRVSCSDGCPIETVTIIKSLYLCVWLLL